MSRVSWGERERKFNVYVEQHRGKFAKQLNKVIVTMHDFYMPIKLTSDSLHEALKHYETNVGEVTKDEFPFQRMDTRTFKLVFDQWMIDFVRTFREALRPGTAKREDD